jgi:hypothetical protein
MSRGPDAATLLERALLADLARLGCVATLSESAMTRWASASFAGARHRITLEAAQSDVLDLWIAALPDADFALRGHLLADLSVTCVHRHDGRTAVTLEALSVEEP